MEAHRQYRGKRIDNREWVYGSLVETPRVYGSRYKIIVYDRETEIDQEYEVYYPTIGQCTGRNDINGEMIYEGDEVTTQWYPKHTVVVKWLSEGKWNIADYTNPKGIRITGSIHDKQQ